MKMWELRRAILAAGTLGGLVAGVQAVQAASIVSAVESEYQGNGSADPLVEKAASTVGGVLVSTSLGGADSRAFTDYGINRIYSSAPADYEQYATSAWVDSFTVGGAAGSTVQLSFTVSVDGFAGPVSDDYSYNFKFYALRGTAWSIQDDGMTPSGTSYDRLHLQQVRPDGGITRMDARDFDGFYNWAPGVDPSTPYASHITYVPAGDYYTREVAPGVNQRFYATYMQVDNNGVLGAPVPYAAVPQLGTIRANLDANYSMLGMTQLCNAIDNECSAATYPGSDLTLNLSLAAGSTFSLAAYLFVDDLLDGTVDFFHTAKVTGISLSPGASLTSQSGTLVAGPDGSYAYQAVLDAQSAVPEPASWALMIGGFALAGAALRRRASVSFATVG